MVSPLQRPFIIVRTSHRGHFRPASVLLLALAATVALAGCRANPKTEVGTRPAPSPAASAAPLAAAQRPAAQTPPAAANPEEHDALHFVTSGPLVAENQADLSFDRDGRVVEIDAQVGDRVRKGQILARLDDRETQAACKSQQARVASLKDQVREWQAEEAADRADLKRADVMLAEHIRSQEDWEHIKYKLDETIQEVARYQQDALAAEADLQSAQIALDQTRLVAPFSGVIGRSSIRMAQEVKKGDVLFW
ncbi:MAG: efflux RND transporter periplasmic adaptor subunit, partial [Terriglobales bacterium]